MGRSSTSLRSLTPFAGAAVLAWVAMPVSVAIDWDEYAAATVVALLGGAAALWSLRGSRRGAIPAGLLFYAAAGLLRDSAGGMSSGAAALAIIPVFAIALHSRSRRDLACILAGQAAFYLVPILVVGGAGYPASQYRAALLSVAVAAIVGAGVQQLVDRIRGQAADARDRERMLERIADASHQLFDSDDARADVCAAAREMSEATVAVIYERVGSELVSTSAAGLDLSGRDRIVAAPGSTAAEAFHTGRPILIEADAANRVASVDLWKHAGRPTTVLYQPLLRGQETLGLLVVGWTRRLRADGSRLSIVALLAREAAAIIARADAMGSLSDEAHTDPLTGLPNRRAWDTALARAFEGPRRLTIAMLDLDRFKAFNDSFGHPAGDRLLKESTAAWRDGLRGGDMLARLGGEEFGLLLSDCDPAFAVEVVERLRARTASGQTCSAGIASRCAGDGAAEVVARADAALYRAKDSGRDRSELAAAPVAAV